MNSTDYDCLEPLAEIYRRNHWLELELSEDEIEIEALKALDAEIEAKILQYFEISAEEFEQWCEAHEDIVLAVRVTSETYQSTDPELQALIDEE